MTLPVGAKYQIYVFNVFVDFSCHLIFYHLIQLQRG